MSILVIAEVSGGKLRKATLNAVTFARRLAATRGDTVAIGVVGSGVGGAATGGMTPTLADAPVTKSCRHTSQKRAAGSGRVVPHSGQTFGSVGEPVVGDPTLLGAMATPQTEQ